MTDTPQRTPQPKTEAIKMLKVTNLEEFLKAHPLNITLNDPKDPTKEMHYATDDIFPCDNFERLTPEVDIGEDWTFNNEFKHKIIKKKAFLQELLSRIHDDIRKNELKKKNLKAHKRVQLLESKTIKTLDDKKAVIDDDIQMKKVRETLITLYNFEEEMVLRIEYYQNIKEVFLND